MHFYVEITDTFGGEANYSWVTRHKLKATTALGAMRRIGNDSGLSWHNVGAGRWDSKSGATCAFIDEWEDGVHSEIARVNLTLES